MPAIKELLVREIRLPLWSLLAVGTGAAAFIVLKVLPPSVSANDERKSESYSVGFVLGHQLHRIKDQLDSDVAARGFKEGTLANEKEEPSALTPADRAAALSRIQNRQAANEQKLSEAELKRSIEFMAALKQKPSAREIAPGIIIEPVGETKGPLATPKEHATLNIIYQAKRTDGSVFDQSPPSGVEVKAAVLVPGLRKALSLMPDGAHWMVYISPDQAFGGSARPGLPSQSVVVYDLQLVKGK